MFFEAGQCPAYSRRRKIQFSGSRRQSPFAADHDKSTNIIEIGYIHGTSMSPTEFTALCVDRETSRPAYSSSALLWCNTGLPACPVVAVALLALGWLDGERRAAVIAGSPELC
jgi:hypothetical protein